MAQKEDNTPKYRDNSRRRSSIQYLNQGGPLPPGWNDVSDTTSGRRGSTIGEVARQISKKVLPNRYARMLPANLNLGQ